MTSLMVRLLMFGCERISEISLHNQREDVSWTLVSRAPCICSKSRKQCVGNTVRRAVNELDIQLGALLSWIIRMEKGLSIVAEHVRCRSMPCSRCLLAWFHCFNVVRIVDDVESSTASATASLSSK